MGEASVCLNNNAMRHPANADRRNTIEFVIFDCNKSFNFFFVSQWIET